jgi:hypothetical protein
MKMYDKCDAPWMFGIAQCIVLDSGFSNYHFWMAKPTYSRSVSVISL